MKTTLLIFTTIALIAFVFFIWNLFLLGEVIGEVNEKSVGVIYTPKITKHVSPHHNLAVEAEVSAYTSDPAETDNSPCISASGKNICELDYPVAACPRKYPFGTQIELPNKKTYTCEDRLHQRYDHRFDLYFKSKEKALKWGVDKMFVIIKGKDK